jgi:hypothetical protein
VAAFFLVHGMDYVNYGRYDYDSLMHYSSSFKGQNGERLITRKDKRSAEFSAGDLATIEQMYSIEFSRRKKPRDITDIFNGR